MLKPNSVLFLLLFFTRVSSQNCSFICNGDFDYSFITSNYTLVTSLDCWNTTASDGLMEVWANGFNGIPSYSGIQFIELNASQAATMYQDFNVSAGTMLAISFAHRGRSGTDSVEVSIGPVGGPYASLGRWGDGNSAWGYHTTTFLTNSSAIHRIRFTPIYWAGGSPGNGNLLDAVSVGGGYVFSASANQSLSCAGNTVNLMATGASSYQWIGGPALPSFVVSPTVSSVYTVVATTQTCVGVQTVMVNVYNPSISISASPSLVCPGGSITLTAFCQGASSYSWNGIAGQFTNVVYPTSATIYTLTANSATLSTNCIISANFQATLLPTPTIVALASKSVVCKADAPPLITASGGTSYVWSGGANTSTIYAGSVTSTYMVSGTGTNGCSNTATVMVTVNLCEGLQEMMPVDDLVVYPNPCGDYLLINPSIDCELQLINQSGKLITSLNLYRGSTQSFHLGNVTEGIYLIRAVGKDVILNRKVIVRRHH